MSIFPFTAGILIIATIADGEHVKLGLNHGPEGTEKRLPPALPLGLSFHRINGQAIPGKYQALLPKDMKLGKLPGLLLINGCQSHEAVGSGLGRPLPGHLDHKGRP